MHGAALIHELKKLDHDLEIYGIAGFNEERRC